MSSSTFVVFQDTLPTTDCEQSTGSTTIAKTQNTTNTLVDKENLNPLTGEPSSGQSTTNKKRKGTQVGVLATKLYVAPTIKKSKESKDDQDMKVKGKGKVSKKRSSAGSRKRGSSHKAGRSSKRTSPLPAVEEEGSPVKNIATQAEIDSRCYDLTVLPLADVTPAYEEKPCDVACSNVKPRASKESSVECEIRDYFSPSLSSVSLPGCSDKVAQDKVCSSPAKEVATFSTPERKRIYAAFTFSTPSPSAERFREITNGITPIPLQLLDIPRTP